MFVNPYMSVTVTGGSNEENIQLVSIIQQSLCNNGFQNVSIAKDSDSDYMPVLAQLKIINPELFDTKIVIGAFTPPTVFKPSSY